MSANEPISVIFVDDEQQILDGLRRQLRRLRNEWVVRYATSASAALALLEETPAHAIVTDMRMPGTSGLELLQAVRDRWPQTVRLMLSGQTDQGQLLSGIGAVHQFMHKPCKAEEVVSAIDRSLQLARVASSRNIRGVVTKLESLPVMSDAYKDLLGALDNDESDADSIAEIVSRDIGISTKLMQMVNSAFFSMPRAVTTVREAVVLLGISNIRALTVTAQIFEAMAAKGPFCQHIHTLWTSSIEIGSLAHALARKHNQAAETCHEARLAGLLSLVGRAVYAYANLDGLLGRSHTIEEHGITTEDHEMEIFGASQEMIGAFALGLWAFHPRIVDAVMSQRQPSGSAVAELAHPLPFVHAARSVIRSGPLVTPLKLDTNWLGSVGFDHTTVQPHGDKACATKLAS